jgi:tRNA threonylcarbamoyladenosine biosynthesis protein TsaB
MLVLTIKTDNPDAEIGLCDGPTCLKREVWHAHRELAETIHNKIKALLDAQNKDWSDLEGIVCFAGPGSFTGLRIGLSVGNALAYGLNVPIVTEQGDEWIMNGMGRLEHGERDPVALPHYGADAHITLPKK